MLPSTLLSDVNTQCSAKVLACIIMVKNGKTGQRTKKNRSSGQRKGKLSTFVSTSVSQVFKKQEKNPRRVLRGVSDPPVHQSVVH